MMNVFYLILMSLLLTACGGGGDNNDAVDQSDTGGNTDSNISISTSLNGESAQLNSGIEIVEDGLLSWTYTITNTGEVNYENLQVTLADEVVCDIPLLAAGTSTTCQSSGFALIGDQQLTVGVVGENTASLATQKVFYSGYDQETLAVVIDVNQTKGDAPIKVIFSPKPTSANAIVKYEWDFQDDGEIDVTDPVGNDQTVLFKTPGTYDVELIVTDNQGDQVSSSVTIEVGNPAPEVSVTLTPSNGATPLSVAFSATAEDSDGIAQFDWDFDGDGVFDESTTSATTSHIYTTQGSYQARLRVTDTLGAETTLVIPTLQVNALVENSPSVRLRLSREEGRVPMTVTLSADVDDPQNSAITLYEWDFDGDGTFDATSTTSSQSTIYRAPGTFYPQVRVTNATGLTAQDHEQIILEPYFDLTLDTDTLDPANNEVASISTYLAGDTNVSLILENAQGQTVRTLLPLSLRAAGNYTDVWDGLDDQGHRVPEGVYHAILIYRENAVLKRYDTGLTSGGLASNPPRSDVPPNFSPLAGDPLDISFTLNRASEVTAFMGLINTDTRLFTFMQRQPLGKGTHVLIWNGENTEGQLIEPPPADSFLFGIFAYTLPDNAIFVRNGVHVSALSVTPSLLQPVNTLSDSQVNTSQIHFELSSPGDLILSINDAVTGVQISEFTYSDRPAGANTLTWDGRTSSGQLVSPGEYRLGITGVEPDTGFKSITHYALQRVFY